MEKDRLNRKWKGLRWVANDLVRKEGGNLVRENKAKHEEHFLSSWLRESKELRKKVQRRRDKEWEKSGGGRNGKGRSGLSMCVSGVLSPSC